MPEKEISIETGNPSLDLALDTLKIRKQALFFVNTKRSAEKTAEDISKKISTNNKSLVDLSKKILSSISSPTKQCRRLADCVKKGVAFHHAGLVSKQRELVEENFRIGLIKIICSTPSLAMGVDLPAYRAIIKDLKRYSHNGMVSIPILEYLQMAGRAGRPKYDDLGEAICLAISNNDKSKIIDKYVNGLPEEIYSKLAVEPVLRTYLLSLIAANFVSSKKEIIDFFKRTFWAHQFVDMDKLKTIIDKMLALLEDWEFISNQNNKGDFVSASEILDGEEVNGNVKATLLGKRIAELYIDPLTANFLIICLKSASSKNPKEISFLHAICNTLEMRPLLRVGVKEQDRIQEELGKFYEFLLEKEPSIYEPEYEDYLNSFKTAIMLHEWIYEKSEEYLLENYNTRPGELRNKIDTADWLLYGTEEICRILKLQHINKEIVKLRIRLKHGIREELLPLVRIRGIGRVRARKLYFNKIKDVGDVKKADILKLVQILGRNTALGIKKNLGQDVKIVPENRRIGQINLNRF